MDLLPDLALLAVLLLPLGAAVLSASVPALASTWAPRLLGAALAVALVAAVAQPSWSLGSDLLLQVDRLAALLVVFVAAVALVVLVAASRMLRGDPARHRFFASSSLAAAATLALVVAADLRVAVLAWVVVSVATVALLRHDGRSAARAAARTASVAFVVGDALLVLATLAVLVGHGPVALRPEDLARFVAEAPTLAGVPLVAVLGIGVVAASVARAALPPLQAWLPMSVAAPTPSSAILHAGIVNGAGLLMVRSAPVLGAALLATGVAIVAGCAAVFVGGSVARTRSDVKTGLAWSTVGQMGYMVVQAATGLLAPAVIHMVGHGMYKANLFLGSGRALRTLALEHGMESPSEQPESRGHAGAAALAIALGVVGLAWWAASPPGITGAAGAVMAGFVAATVAHAATGWLRSRPQRSALDLIALGFLFAATVAALTIAGAVKVWLTPSLPDTTPELSTAGLVLLAVMALASWLLTVLADRPGPARTLADRAWLWAMHIGDPARPTSRLRPSSRGSQERPSEVTSAPSFASAPFPRPLQEAQR